MVDNVGQVSLEYLLIFAISLIVLIVFTMPLAEYVLQDTFDVSDSLNVKSDLSKISQAVKQVYGEGQGSKHSVFIQSSKPLKFNVRNSYISCSIKLKDGSNKVIKVPYASKLKASSLKVSKGGNNIVVEWPVNSDKMIIYTG